MLMLTGQSKLHPLANTPVCTVEENDLLSLYLSLSLSEDNNLFSLSLSLSLLAESQNVTEWDYCPPVAIRGRGAFVGLKNAGCTCYMNSVLQMVRR